MSTRKSLACWNIDLVVTQKGLHLLFVIVRHGLEKRQGAWPVHSCSEVVALHAALQAIRLGMPREAIFKDIIADC